MRVNYGMTQNIHTIKLHPELSNAAQNLAQQRDISFGQLIRDALSHEISRARIAKPPVRADERLIAPLRARLARQAVRPDEQRRLYD